MAVNTKIQFRRGYSTGYAGSIIGSTPIDETNTWQETTELAEGEIGYEIDTGKFKIGRRVGMQLLTWVNLPYAGGSDIGIDITKNNTLYPGSGITLIEDPDSNAYAIYNILKNADNDTNISISNVLASGDLYEGVDNVTGHYYKIGLADDLTNINNITISGTLSSSGIVGLTSNGTSLDIVSTVNKLIPPPPPTINTATLSMANIGILQLGRRLCNFGGTSVPLNSNTAPSIEGITIVAGNPVTGVIFASGTNPGYYQTSYITGIGPGDAGTVSAIKNTVVAGQIDMTTGSNNGTNLDLTIANDRDYSIVNTNVRPGFHESFDVRATGLSSPGWNTVNIRQSGTSTNSSSTLAWYYDDTNQLPAVTNLSVATGVNSSTLYSSSIPHFSGNFVISFDVQYLSSDTYVETVVGSIDNNDSTNAITDISAKTRSNLGLSAIAPRNEASINPTSLSITGVTPSNSFRSVSGGSFSNNIAVSNSRGTTSTAINPNKTVLIKTLGATNAGTILREDNIPVGITHAGTPSPLGNGAGYAVRISGAANNTDTPAVTEAGWNSSAPLGVGDAVVVGGVLKHDYTDYTNYIPSGPNLTSGGRGLSTAQYFTFKITRASVSRLAIRIGSTTGIAGLWFKLPGTTAMDDALNSTNGWASAMVPYNSNGFSNDNIGCAETAVVPQNSPLVNTTSYTITFGEANSSLTTNGNTIYVRIKLTNNQAIQSLFIHQA